MPKINAISSFGGINESKKIGIGEFTSAMNIVSDDYPCASVRLGREEIITKAFDTEKHQLCFLPCEPDKFTGMYFDSRSVDASNNVYYSGAHFFYKDGEVYDETESPITDRQAEKRFFPKSIVDTGEKLYFFPDNKFLNYTEPKLNEDDEWIMEDSLLTMPCYAEISKEMYTDRIYIYPYNKRTTFPFRAGDSITITCNGHQANNVGVFPHADWSCIVDEVLPSRMYVRLYDENGAEQEFDKYDGWHELILGLKTPAINYAITFNNRIYGLDGTGEYLYISALGRPEQFYSDGTASGGCVIPVADKRPWTAIAAVNNQVICFKENTMHIVSGNIPGNFQISNVLDIGCIDRESVAVRANRMFWLAYDGFYMFDGAYPVKISRNIKGRFTKCCSACVGDKYYASCYDGERYRLLVYDIAHGTWLEEDCPGYIKLAEHNHKLVAYRLEDNNLVADVQLEEVSSDTEWFFETGDINLGFVGHKDVSELWLRICAAEGSSINAEVITSTGKRDYSADVTPNIFDRVIAFRVPIMINPDDTFRIRVSGKGKVTIYDIEFAAKSGGKNI